MDADVSTKQCAHLEQLIAILRRRQRVLELQLARYGDNAAPPHILLELEDIARDLRQHLANHRGNEVMTVLHLQ